MVEGWWPTIAPPLLHHFTADALAARPWLRVVEAVERLSQSDELKAQVFDLIL